MENNYTRYMEESALKAVEDVDKKNGDHADFLIKFTQEKFMPFNKRLQRFIKVLCKDENVDFISYIKDGADRHGVEIPDRDRAIKNWINKESIPERDKVFLIVFSLGLNMEQTYDFFRRVYFDRAFDVKNTKEMIYYYCIKNGFDYNKVKELSAIVRIDKEKKETSNVNHEGKTIYTKHIQNKVDLFSDENLFIEYARNHRNDVSGEKIRAHEVFSILKKNILNRIEKNDKNDIAWLIYRVADKDEVKYKLPKYENVAEFNESDIYGNEKTRKMNEFVYDEGFKDNMNKNVNSFWEYDEKSRETDAFLYNYILKTKTNNNSGSNTVFNKQIKAKFPKELFENFPEVFTLSKINKNSKISNEEMRKAIILFLFYNWGSQKVIETNEFEEECNETLVECGFSKLYYGNPFDWLILTCSKYYKNYTLYDEDVEGNEITDIEVDASPVDLLRIFVAEILELED